MKLVRYCVMNFRSVKNSGWIDCDDVTTLVGVNESGKSNLLLALWKLNPARAIVFLLILQFDVFYPKLHNIYVLCPDYSALSS